MRLIGGEQSGPNGHAAQHESNFDEHTGSLPRPADLVELLSEKEAEESYDKAVLDQRIRRAIADIVKRQADCGIDIIDDGEHSKVNWMAYAS